MNHSVINIEPLIMPKAYNNIKIFKSKQDSHQTTKIHR